jgi:hypothetical protein
MTKEGVVDDTLTPPAGVIPAEAGIQYGCVVRFELER